MKDRKLLLGISITAGILLLLTIWALWPDKLILQGEAEAKTVNVSSKVPGRIKVLNFKKGETVKAGEILAELEIPELDAKQEQVNATLEAAIANEAKAYSGSRYEQTEIARNKMNQAKAGAELASKTNKRMQNLFKEGVISAQKADEASAMYTAAQREYNAAQSAYLMLVNGSRIEDKAVATAGVKKAIGAAKEIDSYVSESKITAPVTGEISEISAEEGELIGTGYPVFIINDSDDMWITFNIREDLLPKFKQGTVLKAEIPGIGKKDVPLKVSYIAVRGNYATFRATRARGEYDVKTFEVRAVPTEVQKDLKPGMSAIIRMK